MFSLMPGHCREDTQTDRHKKMIILFKPLTNFCYLDNFFFCVGTKSKSNTYVLSYLMELWSPFSLMAAGVGSV